VYSRLQARSASDERQRGKSMLANNPNPADRKRYAMLVVCLSVALATWFIAPAYGRETPSPSGSTYSDAALGFRYPPPDGMYDKTGRFPALQIQNQKGTPQTLSTLLAMSSGPDSSVPDWENWGQTERSPIFRRMETGERPVCPRVSKWLSFIGC
jgi:hypothetical protein